MTDANPFSMQCVFLGIVPLTQVARFQPATESTEVSPFNSGRTLN